MELVLREMKPGEAKAVQSLATKVFLSSLEGGPVPKPLTAWVAEINNKVVGAFIYTIENCRGKKLGFIDSLVVDAEFAGQGIASKLCAKGISHLWSEECDCLATFVRDDNVGSWAAFEKVGFIRADFIKFVRTLGLSGFIKTYFKHLYGFGVGCDLYFTMRPEKATSLPTHSKKSGVGQIALHLLMNFVLVLTLLTRNVGIANVIRDHSLIVSLLTFFLISFGGVILLGYVGALLSRRKWQYRMPTGGLLLNFILGFFEIFLPIQGNWYPTRYENTSRFRMDMGVTGILPWLYIMGIFVAAGLWGDNLWFIYGGFQGIAGSLLLIRCIPIPLINFGAVRVYKWSKILWGIMVATSIFLLFFW